MNLLRIIFLLTFLFISCSGPSPIVEEDLAAIERELDDDPQYRLAKIFDDLLLGRLTPDEKSRFIKNCQETGENTPFCYSVLNLEKFSLLTAQKKDQARRTRSPTIRPRFSPKQEILNWEEVRTSSVPALLRGIPKTNFAKLMALKTAALQEEQCPNNVAIAVAALLEDRLPSKVSYDVIGRLYEKGGRCLTTVDREQMMTRAGLLYFAHGNYSLAKDIFSEASTTENAFSARALYWLYRTQTQLGEKRAAQKALQTLQSKYPFSFHSLVATTASGKDPGDLLNKSNGALIKRSSLYPELNKLLEQVETLHAYSLDGSASIVLEWAVNLATDAEPEVRVYLAELKKEQGDYRGKISILSDVLYKNPSLISRETMELYFPKVLFPVFEKHSAVIDPYFLLAIARRESAFNPRAISSANARGLMQILPKTGRKIKRKPNLFDPDTNVAVGARYFSELLKKTDGHVHFALAAYNAGPQKVKSWMSLYPTGDPILFTDLIPYRETREYVGSVLRNYYWYRRIHQTNHPIPAEKILELAIAEKH